MTNEKNEPKIYVDNFGELSSDGITLFVHNKEHKIKFQDITKIRFIKRQKFHFNYLSFFVSILLMFFVRNNSLSNQQHLYILLASLVLLLTGFLFKSFQYKLMLIKKNDFIMIDVPVKSSNEVENLVNHHHLLSLLLNK
jgi:hypothetical protein